MADEQSQRTYRPLDSAGRATPKSGSDPLAELARLIGQTDPFGEFGRADPRQASTPAPQPIPAQPHEPAWSKRPAAPIPGYAPQAQPAAQHPSMQGFRVQDYADADLYHTEPATPGYAAHAEVPAYEHEHEEANTAGYGAEDQDFYEDVQPRRRVGIIAIAAVFALAVVATAVAFGYRAIYGSLPSGPPPVIKADTKPIKVVPPSKDSTAKLIQERVPPQDDKLVTREEKPVDVQDKPAGQLPQDQANVQPGAGQATALGTGVIGGEPKKVHTITIRPDQSGNPVAAAPVEPPTPFASASNPTPAAADDTVANAAPAAEAPPPAPVHAAPAPARHPAAARPAPRAAAPVALANAPLSLSPNAPARAAPTHTATMHTASREAAPQPARTGGYAVQISSRRSEADAEAAFRSAQAKYPKLLSGQHSLVRRVDLGQKGVYYRAMIGPFASSEAASRLCSGLKAAGARCFVQRI